MFSTNIKCKFWPVVLFTSSRDRKVKMWRIDTNEGHSKTYSIDLEQTIEGHVHSVWAVDCSLEYLVAGSADKTIRVWRNTITSDTLSKYFIIVVKMAICAIFLIICTDLKHCLKFL